MISFIFSIVVGCFLFSTTLTQRLNRDIKNTRITNGIEQSRYNYAIFDEKSNWTAAFGACRNYGGQLASPLNPDLNDDLRAFSVAEGVKESFWIGGKSNGTSWHWETYNLPVLPHINFPNETCATLQSGYCIAAYPSLEGNLWHWCGQPCDDEMVYVCEFETDLTTTTLTPTTPPTTVSTTTLTPTTPTTPSSTVSTTTVTPTIPSTTTTATITTTSTTTTTLRPRYRYAIFNEMSGWTTAFETCRRNEGQLATPLNPTLDDELRAFVVANDIKAKFWIGAKANGIGTLWHWETYNLPVLPYSNFPNTSCATPQSGYCIAAYPSVEGNIWHWCGQPCDTEMVYVCEFEATMSTPTITTTANPSTTENGDSSVPRLNSTPWQYAILALILFSYLHY